MAKRLYVFSGPIYDESENANWLHRRSVHGDEFTGTSPEAWRLYVANATYRRGARRAEIDTQGVGRLEGEDVVLAVTGGTGNYRNARGEAPFGFQSDGRVVITYELDM